MRSILVVGIVAFILMMLMYGLWALHNVQVDQVMSCLSTKVICVVMVIFCVVFIAKLDFYSFNDYSLAQVQQAISEIESELSGMLDEFIN